MENKLFFYPEAAAAEVSEDTELILSGFDEEPVLSPEGRVLIFDGKELADEILFADETVILGGDGVQRESFNVSGQLVRTGVLEGSGKGAVYIRPHPGALKAGRSYTVEIDFSSVTGTVGGTGFKGITEDSGWQFTVRKALPEARDGVLTVDNNPGSNPDFRSIQGALDFAQSKGNASRDFTIKVMPGTYHELLYYGGSGTVTLSGQGKAGQKLPDYSTGQGIVNVVYENAAVINSSEEKRNLLSITNGSFVIENMGFENTYSRIGNPRGSQSEVIGMSSESGTFAAYNCYFKGHQDTIRTEGKAWFYACFISGDTDFIWTESRNDVLLVERCRLKAVFDRFKNEDSHLAYITAPRMEIGSTTGKGIVIKDCEIIVEKGEKAWLGRTPWKNGYYNQATFINNTITVEDGAEFICDWKNEATQETLEVRRPGDIGWKQFGNEVSGKAVKKAENGFSEILEEELAENEYSRRESIINRVFSTSLDEWHLDDNRYWDINALIRRMGWL